MISDLILATDIFELLIDSKQGLYVEYMFEYNWGKFLNLYHEASDTFILSVKCFYFM